jgi:hypothetical protein
VKNVSNINPDDIAMLRECQVIIGRRRTAADFDRKLLSYIQSVSVDPIALDAQNLSLSAKSTVQSYRAEYEGLGAAKTYCSGNTVSYIQQLEKRIDILEQLLSFKDKVNDLRSALSNLGNVYPLYGTDAFYMLDSLVKDIQATVWDAYAETRDIAQNNAEYRPYYSSYIEIGNRLREIENAALNA